MDWFVSNNDIQNYANIIKSVYQDISQLSDEDLHDYLIKLEHQYIYNCIDNFAHTIYKLNPGEYFSNNNRNIQTNTNKWSINDILCCHNCGNKFDKYKSYDLHVKKISICCDICKLDTTFIDLVVISICKNNINDNSNSLLSLYDVPIKKFSTVKNFTDFVNVVAYDRCINYKHKNIRLKKLKKEIIKKLQTNGNNIGFFKYNLIYGMYRQIEFIKKIHSSVDLWIRNNEFISTSIKNYSKFMNLIIKYKYKILVPTLIIDFIWHSHQNNSLGYKNWCMENNNKIINHNDNINKSSLNSYYKNTYLLWYDTYKQIYSTNKPKFNYFEKCIIKFSEKKCYCYQMVIKQIKIQ